MQKWREFFESWLFNPAETPIGMKDIIDDFKRNYFLSKDEIKEGIIGVLEYYRVSSITGINRLRELSSIGYLPENILNETVESFSQALVEEKCRQYFDGKIGLEEIFDNEAIHLKPTNTKTILVDCLNRAAIKFLKDGVISEEEYDLFKGFMDRFNFSLEDILYKYPESNTTKVVQLKLLSDLQNGKPPSISVTNAPIVLKKDEFIVWVYKSVYAYEERSKSEWVGGNMGVSLRLFKGVYYHIGQSKKKIDRQYLAEIGKGAVILTNKNLIFYSPSRSIKIAYRNIIALVPYNDGVEVQQQSSQKRLILSDMDSWFIMNLLSTLGD